MQNGQMAHPGETPIAVLVRFARLASEAPGPSEILPLLAAAAVEQVGADAAAVLQVIEGGELKLVAGQGLPAALTGWQVEADGIGVELGQNLRRACGDAFGQADTIALVWAGDLYGALVLLGT